jgi:putative Ca2+/H+ antiporter (TMEM165/GDT1 family)
MSWFAVLLMVMAAGFVATDGGRAQLLVARLAKDLGRSQGLLLSALATSSATMLLAVWIGSVARLQLDKDVIAWLAALAMLGASIELLWPVRMREAKEPTRSLGAVSLVLIARQLVDAPRLVVFAASTQLAPAFILALGGALGGGVCLWFGWRFGDMVDRRVASKLVRWTMGLILLMLAVLLAAKAVNPSVLN